MPERNLMLPGNPRYQPKELQPYFGYDNLYAEAVTVELAAMDTLHVHRLISDEDWALLTPEVRGQLATITTTEVDRFEREVTKHDIRALVRCMQERMPEPLRRWVHVLLTSYDVLDTARALAFRKAHQRVVEPKLKEVLAQFARMIREYADVPQVGRTHGQHAVPITVGFWLANTGYRLLHCTRSASRAMQGLVGKASGPVGAHNAAALFGIPLFEDEVTNVLGFLKTAPISTQVVPPEPLLEYLFACLECSGTLGQFGRDCRHLMRTEIGEVAEAFEEGQVGSSTMAHKRNPINFESLEGMWQRSVGEFVKLLPTLISEHQRDLTGSSVLRDAPIIVVNLVQQLNTLLRQNKSGRTFLSRIHIDREACAQNLQLKGNVLAAEAAYIALQFAGYPGDAHELINRQVVSTLEGNPNATLFSRLVALTTNSQPELNQYLTRMPDQVLALLRAVPPNYTGLAAERARSVAASIEAYVVDFSR